MNRVTIIVSESQLIVSEMPDILAIIEEQMRADDETTATQIVKIVNAAGYKVSKWIFHYIASQTSSCFFWAQLCPLWMPGLFSF